MTAHIQPRVQDENYATFTLRLCGWSAFIAVAIALGGLAMAGVLPFPLGPDSTQQEVVAFYSGGAPTVLGLGIASVGLGLVGLLIAGITFVMWRSEGEYPILTLIQLVFGTITVACLMFPMMLMAVTAFRPGRGGELTVMLNDISWLMFIFPIAPFITQNVAIAAGILTSERPMFPRWIGYFNLWVGFTFTFDVMTLAFREGPFSWNKLLILWLALTSYSLWVLVMGYAILKAVPVAKSLQTGLAASSDQMTRTASRADITPDKPEAGMWLFILLDMSTFGLFFAVYLWEMSKNRDAFVADAAHLIVPMGLINTLVLLTSSYAVAKAVHANRRQDASATSRNLGVALGAASLFLVVKVAEYMTETLKGHGLTSSPFFSFYYILTGIHLLHICIGSLLLSRWRIKTVKGENPSERWSKSVAVYWHMVDLLWIIIFSLLYIGSNI